jgi:chemotaxis protein methyltransferase CheR
MDSLVGLREYIKTELGIKMPATKVPMLESRLQRRVRSLNLGSFAEYQRYLFNSPGGKKELIEFVDAVTTNKTDFYREPSHFDVLVKQGLADILKIPGRAPSTPLKVWCAGCSTGEEPYTIAMILAEHGPAVGVTDFRILATDISTRVLAHAKAAVYDAERIDPLPVQLRRYVMRSKDPQNRVVRVVPELRRRVSFHRLNFMDANYGVAEQFDVVFFRNVAIYFDGPTQEAVVTKLCKNLRPGGYFFLGQSESLSSTRPPLRHIGPSAYRRT